MPCAFRPASHLRIQSLHPDTHFLAKRSFFIYQNRRFILGVIARARRFQLDPQPNAQIAQPANGITDAASILTYTVESPLANALRIPANTRSAD